MSMEKRLSSIPVTAFTLNSQANGVIHIPDASLFVVKQQISVGATGQQIKQLEVKRVPTATTILVGPIGQNIDSREDLSAYTVGASAFLFADEQERPRIPEQAVERATFYEEPVHARRVIGVDKLGNVYGTPNNPISIIGTVSTSGGFVWDDIVLTRDSDGDITKAIYKLATIPVRVLDLYYDFDKNLIQVIKS